MTKLSFSFKLVGLVKDAVFHMGKAMLEDIKLKYGGYHTVHVQSVEMLEFDWRIYLEQIILCEKGEMWMFSQNALFFNGEQVIGGIEQFQKYIAETFQYTNYRPLILYEAMAEEAYQNYFAQNLKDVVFLDISINGDPTERLLIELFSDSCPKTCLNFKCLCTGEKGRDLENGYKLHYQGTILHRVLKNGWVQGGDIDLGKGNKGYSIYGAKFEDENFAVPHDRRGIVGMANSGRHSNRSQFYVTFQAHPWMNKKYVAFGKVIEGFDLLKKLESQETFNERPKKDCVVKSSGVFYDAEAAAKQEKRKEEEREQLRKELLEKRNIQEAVEEKVNNEEEGVETEKESEENESAVEAPEIDAAALSEEIGEVHAKQAAAEEETLEQMSNMVVAV